ncbi:MAG: Cys-Gln thioester bond-forming surface protein [Clostridia bacterium]|nr:Cys-Gln thioester bond-forming surface protein [Clostridia bacterium]
MKIKNRILSAFCALTTLVNTFAGFLIPSTTYASVTSDEFIGSRILLVDKGTCGKHLTYNGEEIQAKFVTYAARDGNEYAAYCNEPSFQGVGSNGIHFGEYIVKSKVTDDRLWRVATAGFPYKTPTEMGANGEREAFFATKQAIYRTLDDEPISNYGSLNSEGENMIEVIQELYDIGLNGTDKYVEPELTVNAETSETVLDETDPKYKSQIFSVEGNCEFEEYEVLFDISNLPLGTKITSEDGIEKTIFDSDEKFKVMVSIEENETTSFEIQVKASLKSMPVYQAECDNIRMQTMLVTASPYETVITDVAVKLNKISTSIKIIKRDSITNEKLGNATFEVTKVDGEIIGTFVTDNNGEVEIKVVESGYYKIKELEAPDGYLLADNADDNEQIVLVEFDKENIVTFLNDKKAGLEIIKIDKDTGKALANARYRVTQTDGTIVGEYTTNNVGKINIQDLMPGWYEVQEISAPTNYLRDEKVHKILIEQNEVTTLTLTNKELKGIQIIKKDSVTEKPLANATFSIKEVGGSLVGEYTTNEMGIIEIQHLKPAFYEIKEVSAPRGYLIDTESKIVEVTSKESVVVEFFNTAKGGLQIKKVDEKTGEPLANAKFRVTTITGQTLGEFTTNRTGFINLPELEDGWYVVEETVAPDNYILDNTPKTVEVRGDKPTIVEFTNREKGGIQILKVDAATGVPLEGAKFRVTTKNGLLIGEYTTDKQGHINLSGLDNGWYTILEIEAPKGYILDDVKQDVEVTGYKNQIVEFTNKMKAGLQILKIDYNTGKPLADAKFRVSKMNGKIIGEYVTSRTGYINIGDLDEGWYIVEEILAPEGYALNTTPQNVKVESNKSQILEFANKQLAGIEIIKYDEYTKAPLAGAKFKVTTKTGDFVGEYKTDSVGKITIPNLDAGWYSVQETEAPKGYLLDSTVKDVQVTYYENAVVEFTNRAKAGLQILKVDSVTKQGLKDVKFKVSKINGELVGTYTTDASGMIYLSSLNEGWYIVQEISTINGYKIDTTPRNVEVKSNVATVVEFENTPYSTLIVEKIDSVTTKPIAGVKFHITKENGEYVGDFTTDSFGQIKLAKTLNAGTYIVTETTPLDGYKLDTITYKVTLGVGETKLLQVKNLPYGSLKITKTDKDTKEILKGVEYVLVSEDGTNKWELVTDKNGEINISNKLEEGIYYLTETKALNGYVKDSKEYKVEIKWGKLTTLNLTNEKIKGKIQVIKTSADNNQVTGVLANTRLVNAKFEIRNTKGKLIETITSNYEGVATSKALEYGTYIVKEIKAPANYILDTNEYTVVIKDGQTKVLNITNKSVNVGVTIEKTGLVETQCLDTIRYDFNNIKNNSNVALDNFTWHDSLPIETKLQKVFTGTWSQNLTYSVKYKTNFETTYRLVADNLFTTQVYELDFTNIALQRDEYITDIVFEFGTVEAGFTQIQAPFIYTKVNNFLKDGTEIMNYTEVFGFYNNYKVSGNSSWKTLIFNKTLPIIKIPKTGW